MSEPKSHRETMRCPTCLEMGRLIAWFGNYACRKCERVFAVDRISQWNKAFEIGREFQRENPDAP